MPGDQPVSFLILTHTVQKSYVLCIKIIPLFDKGDVLLIEPVAFFQLNLHFLKELIQFQEHSGIGSIKGEGLL